MRNNPNKIITHHAVSSTGHTAQDVNHWHYDRWGGYARSRRMIAPYVGYHIIVEWDGTIVQCRDFDEEGIHCKGQNFSSIGVCFMGNNDRHMPSIDQIRAWREVYNMIRSRYPHITPNMVFPHRKYANKSCHGALLTDRYWSDQIPQEEKSEQLKLLIEKLQMLKSQLLVLLTKERMK